MFRYDFEDIMKKLFKGFTGISLLLLATTVQAGEVQYHTASLRVTGYWESRRFPTVEGHTVVAVPNGFTGPQLPGCPGVNVQNNAWLYVVTATSPFTVALKTGAACFQGRVVTNTSQLDEALVEELAMLWPRNSVLETLSAVVASRCLVTDVGAVCTRLRQRLGARAPTAEQVDAIVEEAEGVRRGLSQ